MPFFVYRPQTIGKKMGLDTNSNASLWKDRALVEANVAVIHSFQVTNTPTRGRSNYVLRVQGCTTLNKVPIVTNAKC